MQVPTPSLQEVPEEVASGWVVKPILSCLLRRVGQARSFIVPPDWLAGEQEAPPPSLCSWLQLVAGLGAMDLPERWSAPRHAEHWTASHTNSG